MNTDVIIEKVRDFVLDGPDEKLGNSELVENKRKLEEFLTSLPTDKSSIEELDRQLILRGYDGFDWMSKKYMMRLDAIYGILASRKTEYVCGFMFDQDQDRVALIRKERPAWQRGKLNGIGGKVERNESPVAAMVREFTEETGCITLPESWKCFCRLEGENYVVHFFAAKSPYFLTEVRSITDEVVKVLNVSDANIGHPETSLPNLKWLVPLAAQSLQILMFARVGEGRNDGLDEHGRDRT